MYYMKLNGESGQTSFILFLNSFSLVSLRYKIATPINAKRDIVKETNPIDILSLDEKLLILL